jgi:hypothetical protein
MEVRKVEAANKDKDSAVRHGHSIMANCAASVAIREALAAGVPEDQHRIIGMRAGWAVLIPLGYEVPDYLQVQMGMVSAENV